MATREEELRVKIRVDETGKLQAELAGVNRSFAATDRAAKAASSGGFQSMAAGIGSLSKLLPTIGAASAVAGLVSLGKEAFATAGRLSDVADRTGVTAETIQELSFAADQAGVSAGGMERALEGFARRVGQARDGSGALVSALKDQDKALLRGIQSASSTEEALDLVFRKLGETSNAADRAALANAAFGKSGIELLPMLSGGAAGLEEMRRRARDLGLVLSNEMVASGDAAGDSLDELSKTVSGTLRASLLALAPAIKTAAEGLTEILTINSTIAKGDAAEESFNRLAFAIQYAANRGIELTSAQRKMILEGKSLKDVIDQTGPAFERMADAGVQRLQELAATGERTVVSLRELRSFDVIDREKLAQEVDAAVEIVKTLDGIQVSIDEEFLRKNMSDVRKLIEEFPSSIPEKEREILLKLLADTKESDAALKRIPRDIYTRHHIVPAGESGRRIGGNGPFIESAAQREALGGALPEGASGLSAAAQRAVLAGERELYQTASGDFRTRLTLSDALSSPVTSGATFNPNTGGGRSPLPELSPTFNPDTGGGGMSLSQMRQHMEVSLEKPIVVPIEAEGSPRLPFSRYFGEYAPGVIADFTADASQQAIALGFRKDPLFTPAGAIIAGKRDPERFVPASINIAGMRERLLGPDNRGASSHSRAELFVKDPDAERRHRESMAVGVRTTEALGRLARAAEIEATETRGLRTAISTGTAAAYAANVVGAGVRMGTGRTGWR